MRVFRVTALLILLLSAAAFADNVTFNTSPTLGCFSTGSCTPSLSIVTYSPSGSGNDITFTGIGTSGNVTSSGGSATIGLGSFAWQGSYNGISSSENFYATVVFNLPTGISGGQTFAADITGTYKFIGNDTLIFNFSNNSGNPLAVTFSNSSATGSFNFYVNDVTMTTGSGNGTLTGYIANASQTPIVVPPPPPPPSGEAPEPGSLVLMGSGLVAMAGILRRKLRR